MTAPDPINAALGPKLVAEYDQQITRIKAFTRAMKARHAELAAESANPILLDVSMAEAIEELVPTTRGLAAILAVLIPMVPDENEWRPW